MTSGAKQKKNHGLVDSLNQKYGIFRAAKFGIAGSIGFFVAEAILTLGVLVLYRRVSVPGGDYSSLPLILLNVVAFGTAVTAAFFVNEKITVPRKDEPKGKKNLIMRLLKFQLAYLAGNVVTILVQLGLLATISLTPILGNIIGAIVAFPVSYLISMKFVWKLNVAGEEQVGTTKLK